jgi:hypothetical protein
VNLSNQNCPLFDVTGDGMIFDNSTVTNNSTSLSFNPSNPHAWISIIVFPLCILLVILSPSIPFPLPLHWFKSLFSKKNKELDNLKEVSPQEIELTSDTGPEQTRDDKMNRPEESQAVGNWSYYNSIDNMQLPETEDAEVIVYSPTTQTLDIYEKEVSTTDLEGTKTEGQVEFIDVSTVQTFETEEMVKSIDDRSIPLRSNSPLVMTTQLELASDLSNAGPSQPPPPDANHHHQEAEEEEEEEKKNPQSANRKHWSGWKWYQFPLDM